jgi:hypothetical protein
VRGGGGGGGGGGAPTGAPDVALLVVSGHAFGVDPAYLRLDAGPEIEADLEDAGWSVSTSYYVDGATAEDGFGGYADLVADLAAIRDAWAPQGTRVVVVAHSHGGVWAHGALRAVPDLDVRALVDLDASSYGWTLLHDPAPLGGAPEDEYAVGVLVSWPQYPAVPSEPTGSYDLEDVVFGSVADALEVRSGDAPLGGEWFDEKWNVRTDGTTDGLWAYYSGGSHAEVHATGGTTLAAVRGWLRDRLAK